MAKEAGVLGCVSFFLTLLNIGCIVLMAVIVLKIKEVAPNVTCIDLKKEFWNRDIKIARDSYKTYHGHESNQLAKRFLDEWKALQKSEGQSSDDTEAKDAFHDILEDLEHDHTYQGVVHSIPSSPNPQIFERQLSHEVGLPENELLNTAYHTIHIVPTSDRNHVTMEIFHPLLKHSNKSRGYHEYQRQKSHFTVGSSWDGDSYQPKTRGMSHLKNFFQKNEQPKVRFTVTKVNENLESVPEESGKNMAAQSSSPAKRRSLFRLHKFNVKPKKKFPVPRVNKKGELKTLV